ncbi:MAG TPA: CSLREA domain-containing protein, partial [Pyrinomonadaceae bacterium]|nr:CSLREA domain-containing protein [Pyrinomonadaceae bacterium]
MAPQINNATVKTASGSTLNPVNALLSLTVNTLGDAGDSSGGDGHCDTDGNLGNGDQCTLRAAIEETNSDLASDTIMFDPSLNGATVTLNTALPDINGNLTITGPGSSLLTVQRSTVGGTPNFRIFTIPTGLTVNISGLTISNGRTDNNGGGILNQGTLTISGSRISNHSADFGGAIFNEPSGTLNITTSSISTNTTIGGSGAGILSQGTLTIRNSTISNNTVGGAIFIGSGTATIINSTISNNSTQGGGGGITFSGSPANTHIIANCTLTGNRADSPGNTGGTGGGILRLIGTVSLRNTIVAGNFRGSGAVADDITGTVDLSSSFNLIGIGGSGGLTNGVNQNQVGVSNPGIGALGDNGGPTQTHRLLSGSPAIDRGDNCVLNNSCTPALGVSLTTDQRDVGFNRAVNGDFDGIATVDVGAFEAQSVLLGPPIKVTNTNDGGAGSLRAAILDANSAGNAINFETGLTGTITLLSELPNLSASMSINGPGASQLTVQRSTAGGTPNFRIFTISSGAIVTISGLTISNGNAAGGFPANSGGGIFNEGTLSINECVINGNNANAGGAIANLGTLTVSSTTITDNNATSLGGGISNSTGATQSAVLTVNNSTISNNHTQNAGGGIFNIGQASITNSTLSSNTAGAGAGINNANPMTLSNVTIVNNSASNQGGGIFNPGIGSLTFNNTLIAGNTSPSGPDGSGANFISQDYNLIGNTSGLQINGATSHNITNVNARLGTLSNNGGATRTHELLDGSPAIDAGNSSLTTDQRGQPRPVDDLNVANAAGGNASDIGAFEAPTFQVNSIADTDDGACTLPGTGNGCTLREAINKANTVAGADLITF